MSERSPNNSDSDLKPEHDPDQLSDQNFNFHHLDFRQVPSKNGVLWLKQAWDLFKHNPGVWIGSLMVMFITLFIMMLIPIINLFAGVAGPILIAGFMYGGWKELKNQQFTVSDLFAGFREQFSSLLVIGAVYLLSNFFAFILGAQIAAWVGYPILEVTPEQVAKGTVDIQRLIESLVLPLLIMMALLVPVFMAFWFAPALIILHNQKPITALRLSFKACAANVIPFTVYGLVAFGIILIFGVIIALISLVIPALSFFLNVAFQLTLTSLLFASILTSYVDIFNLNPQSNGVGSTGNLNDVSDNDDSDQGTLIA